MESCVRMAESGEGFCRSREWLPRLSPVCCSLSSFTRIPATLSARSKGAEVALPSQKMSEMQVVGRKEDWFGGLLFKLPNPKVAGPCQSFPVGSEAHVEDFHQLICDVCAQLCVNKPFRRAWATYPMTSAGKWTLASETNTRSRGQDPPLPWEVSEWILRFSFRNHRLCLPFGFRILLQRLLGSSRFPLSLSSHLCLWWISLL